MIPMFIRRIWWRFQQRLFCWENHYRGRAISDALQKAVHDPFAYALGTRDGSVFRFSVASVRGKWVHLSDGGCEDVAVEHPSADIGHMDRGVDVRLADIVWVADCPEGS